MSDQLAPFAPVHLDQDLLALLIDEHRAITLPRLERLWSYYRNALAEPTDQGGSQGPPAQAAGLPDRLIGGGGATTGGETEEDTIEREIVIENDIAWRVHTLVDFMFPESPRLVSKSTEPHRAAQIEAVLNAVFEANGGVALWQNAALLGSVYGHVDFLLRCEPLAQISTAGGAELNTLANTSRSGAGRPGSVPSNPAADDLMSRIGSLLAIETVEATRAIPLLNPADYRALDAYIIHYEQSSAEVDRGGWLERLSRAMLQRPGAGRRRATITVTEIHSATHCQRYENEALVFESINRLGRLPVVHVQNLAQPLLFEGLSDVEPLIPLQDELNTRLCDRANRVTMQSFRMWLAKGIADFSENPVGPGQMWSTDNLDASIEPFGGDADSPSENAHLEELREALDKASGVTPAAAGHIKARVGNLTSENALRISLMGTVAKTKRKRVTYGAGIQQLCELILHALDVYGLLRTTPRERRVEIVWSDPIATDESRKLADALAKAQLGVPTSVLRAELGYPDERAS